MTVVDLSTFVTTLTRSTFSARRLRLRLVGPLGTPADTTPWDQVPTAPASPIADMTPMVPALNVDD